MGKRTLLVRGIKNLTQETMWVYGTSGKLVKLVPEKPELTSDGKLAGPTPDTYYIAVGFILDILIADRRFRGPIAEAIFVGHGPKREKIYKIKNSHGLPIVPITDGIGWPGYIEPKSRKVLLWVGA